MEDYARILDYLPQGLPDEKMFHREPVAYAIGEDQFKLFELVPKQGITLNVGDKVELIPSHCCTTVNLHDTYYGIRKDEVETVWPIAARGRSQ
ncbi:MAG: DUF655 domain-containing protein [Acidobacteriia bacterium]|nr:DUF655 domain-containing protein [Terriglobia bacterium]